MALRNQPYLPLYVQDFISDEKLRECSAESVGVYIFLMCIMHKSDEYGKIKLSQKYVCSSKIQAGASTSASMFATMLSKQMPFTTTVIERALIELLSENVIKLDENDQVLIQKRMVKDCEISQIRALSGGKGGNKRVANSKDISSSKNQAKGQAKDQANTEYEYVIETDNESDIKSDNEVDNLNMTDVKYIIDYLNYKLGTSYKKTSDKTQKLIHARFNDGFTVDNFYSVIDKKCEEWQGTEYEKFLRPETLFSNKFEGYLNQCILKPTASKSQNKKETSGNIFFDMLKEKRDIVYEQD
jgi:uncharacterized phage protein (TIGR02220 family)